MARTFSKLSEFNFPENLPTSSNIRREYSLKDRRDAWLKAGGKGAFCAPDAYTRRDPRGSVTIESVPSHVNLDFTVGTPALFRMKDTFPPWLWDACHKALDALDQSYEGGLSFSGKKREAAMREALSELPDYPPHPSSPFPASQSVQELRDILELAPIVPDYDDEYLRFNPKVLEDENAKYCGEYQSYDGNVTHFWTAEYHDMVYKAMIKIIEDYGLDGWENVRWEVYDAVSITVIDRLVSCTC